MSIQVRHALAGLLLLAVGFLTACGASASPASQSSFVTPTVSPVEVSPISTAHPTPWPKPNLTETSIVERATITAVLPTIPTITPIPGIDPATAHMLQQMDQYHRAIMTAVPARVPPTEEWGAALNNPTPEPDSGFHKRRIGAATIIDNGCNLGHASLVDPQNTWFEPVGEDLLEVCVGADWADKAQGLIEVVRADHYREKALSTPETYQTPERRGTVRIIDAVGERLTLQAADGTLWSFDVPTREWSGPTPSPSFWCETLHGGIFTYS